MPAPTRRRDAGGPAPPTLVPVTVAALPEEVPSGEIKIEIHRAQGGVSRSVGRPRGRPVVPPSGCVRCCDDPARAGHSWRSCQSICGWALTVYHCRFQQQALGRSPCDGTAYTFHNHQRQPDQVAGLEVWNRGLAVCETSLHQGALHLAPQHGYRVHAECGRMAVAQGSRLASPRRPSRRMPGRSEARTSLKASV